MNIFLLLFLLILSIIPPYFLGTFIQKDDYAKKVGFALVGFISFLEYCFFDYIGGYDAFTDDAVFSWFGVLGGQLMFYYFAFSSSKDDGRQDKSKHLT